MRIDTLVNKYRIKNKKKRATATIHVDGHVTLNYVDGQRITLENRQELDQFIDAKDLDELIIAEVVQPPYSDIDMNDM